MQRASLIALATSAAAFALASVATAGYAPRLVVNHGAYATGAATSLEITASQPADDDDTAHVSILAPSGYTVDLGVPAGRRIGTASVTVNLTRLGISNFVLKGVVQAGDVAALAAEATACTGTPTHAAAFLIVLDTSAGAVLDPTAPRSISIPAFVDPASASEAAAGFAYHLQICLQHPSTAPAEAQIRAVTLTISGLVRTPSAPGRKVWAGLFTPYNAAGSAPNQAGTTESRGIVVFPASLTLSRLGPVTVRLGRWLRLTGRLLQRGGRGPVTILSGSSPAELRVTSSRPTNRDGDFGHSARARRRGAIFFQARFGPTDATATGCANPTAQALAGCTSATLSALTSQIVRFNVRR